MSSNTHVRTLFYLTKDGAVHIDAPSLTDVINAAMTLDGRDVDTLSVTLSNGDSMDVGGGSNGQYKCHARVMDSFFDLVDPLASRDMLDRVDLHMNDEINTFPRCTIVSQG